MAHTPYTGKSVGNLLTYDSDPVPGWRKVVIKETAGPLPAQLDTTTADDATYQRMEDPMGAKGTAKTTVTIDGLASKADVADSGLFSLAMDSSAAFVFQAASGAGKDKFSLSPVLKRRSRPGQIESFVPYTLVFEKEDVGTWAASPS